MLFLTQNAPETAWRPVSARTRWGSSQRSPRPPSWITGVGPPGGRGPGKGMEGREGKEGGKGEGGKGKGREKGGDGKGFASVEI